MVQPVARASHRPGDYRLWQWLKLPWRALDPGAQWLIMSCLLLALAGMVLTIPFTGPHWPILAAIIIGFAVAFSWLYFFPNSLRLVCIARILRVPHASRQVQASLLLYLVLSTLVPAVILHAAGAHGLPIGLALLGIAAGSFVIALLPTYAYFPLLALGFSLNLLGQWLHLPPLMPPRPGDAHFIPFLCLLDVGLVCLAVARWQLVTTRPLPAARSRRPLVMSLSRQVGFAGLGNSLVPDEREVIRQRPNWLQPKADVRDTGPNHLRRSLRVALGGGWLPLTRRSRWRQWLLGSGAVLASILFVALIAGGDVKLRYDFMPILVKISGWLVLYIGFVVTLVPMLTLHRRWSSTHAELPLMALLPGLGNTVRLKRTLLQLCLRTPLMPWMIWAPLAWVLMSWRHGDAPLDTALIVIGLASLGSLLTLSLSLGILGHQRLRRGGMITLTVYMLLLSLASGSYALAVGFGGELFSASVATTLALFWALLLVPLVAFIVNGWRRWQQLPHPFLVREG